MDTQLNKINSQTLGVYKDTLLDVPYQLLMVSYANELSDNLKATLSKMDVDYNDYNQQSPYAWSKGSEVSSDNPPAEIYEYQNFFLLENKKGELILLDGFRRLLWYSPPCAPILVRVYKEADLDSKKILSLLVSLNHFKFFGGGSYHERGFSLLLRTLFGVDITKFKPAFDAYLSSNEIKSSGSIGGDNGVKKNGLVKDRIINDYFVSDMRFLEKLAASGHMCNSFVGALLFKRRAVTEGDFDFEQFDKLVKSHSVMPDLAKKYANVGTDRSFKSQGIVNKIMEIYENLFIQMTGGTTEKSYAEKIEDCKNLVATLKKDKNLTKMTGSQNIHRIVGVIEKRLNAGEEVKFTCVVHPINFNPTRGRSNPLVLPHGLLQEPLRTEMVKSRHWGAGMRLQIRLDKNDTYYLLNHADYDYNKLETYKVDLFVNIPQSEIPKAR